MCAHTPVDPAKIERQKRLEETLKENLRRRKAQARARSEAPARPGVMETEDDEEE
ncbi:hypothetical protein [Aureimonas sp. AU20]|uniref:hypothetical protein n=1 Tax=Aureimonas sp. AU20 TaxID=1349819 RepID=UPI0007230349|nr:hypothetical protein [Aureimonas sp. AU20]ALN72868.1 hypothetical protein M673_09080 [Aureimonas sp. AU20]